MNTTSDDTAADEQRAEHVSEAALRAVMRHVPAAVTVVTARGGDEQPLGVTIGSFTSVSLRPPLISFNVAREANVYALLKAADCFAVHLLRHRQAPLAARFADPDLPLAEQFEGVAHRLGPGGVPVLEGVLAVLHCRPHARFPAGDSDVVIGRVVGVERGDAPRDAGGRGGGRPLVYHRRGYRSIEAEAKALEERQGRSEEVSSEEVSSEENRTSRRVPETPDPKSAKS